MYSIKKLSDLPHNPKPENIINLFNIPMLLRYLIKKSFIFQFKIGRIREFTSTAMGLGSIPGRGTKILQAVQHGQKKMEE